MDSWWDLAEHSGYDGNDLALYRLKCAFCGHEGNFETAHREVKTHPVSRKKLYFDTLRCGNCANFLLVFWSSSGRLHDYKTVPWALASPKAPDAWPQEVSRFWLQARNALRRNDLDAASVMARSALQAALRARDASGKTLKADISDLAAKGLLPPVMKEWSDELRELGNASAHPSPEDGTPARKDVADVIEFLEFLLSYLFTLPSRIAEYRGRKAKEE